MDDDEPIADACIMPSLMSSLEDGRGKLSRNPRTETSFVDCKLEPSVRDLSRRVTRSNSRLSLDGGERYSEERGGGGEAKDAKGNNNNNNCNGGGERRRRASAVEILRRNFGVSRSPSLCFNTNSRMQRGAELEPREANGHSDVSNGRATEAGECKKSERETGDAGTKNEPTASDSTASDAKGVERVAVTSRRSSTRDGDADAVASDESLNGKEHVYCTVYCIESESRRKKDVEITDDEAVASDAPDVALDSEAGREAAPSPEPAALYTLDDLVDPLGDVARRPSARQAGAETATQSCRVCLEEKTIAPLPCCRKAVCDECLKLYVSSQVGEGGCLVQQGVTVLNRIQGIAGLVSSWLKCP